MSSYPKSCALYNKNTDKVINSSSGGVFCILAEYVIESGGIVFGAGFDEEFNVIHKGIENLKQLDDLMRSKYVESSVGNTFIEVKEQLKKNRYVLFSGTPCQIAGLKSFLRKDYEKLLTVDFICHGVPSRKVWRDYLNCIAKGETVNSVNFRDKTSSWSDFALKICFNDGSSYYSKKGSDPYVKGFLQNLYLRPSCYECSFKTTEKISDITLGDFWGIPSTYSDEILKNGVSVLLTNNIRAEKLLKKLNSNYCSLGNVDLEYISKCNSALVKAVNYNEKRDVFFKDYGSVNLIENININTRISFKKKFKNRLMDVARRIWHKIK